MRTITRIWTLAALGLVAQGALAGLTQEEADRLEESMSNQELQDLVKARGSLSE